MDFTVITKCCRLCQTYHRICQFLPQMTVGSNAPCGLVSLSYQCLTVFVSVSFMHDCCNVHRLNGYFPGEPGLAGCLVNNKRC